MEPSLIKKLFDRKNILAVVGASNNPEKYGYKVYKYLKEAGYKVYPVNPNANEILGDKCYPNLKKLPLIPDIVNTVVPPKATEQIVEDCITLGVKMIWMQPGSESENAIRKCESSGIEVIYGACIMVQLRTTIS